MISMMFAALTGPLLLISVFTSYSPDSWSVEIARAALPLVGL